MVEMFLDRRPLIPDGARVVAVVVAVAAAAVVAVLGARYAHDTRAGRFDRRIDHFLGRLEREHHHGLQLVSDLGSPASIVIMVLVLGAILFLAGRPRAALLVAIAPGLAAAITEWLLKPLVDRTLEGTYSFPSGHTTGIFGVALVIVVAMLDRLPPRPPVVVAGVVSLVSLAVAAGVAAALVADHYHYATDTVAGACVALATVLVVSLGIDLTFDALR